MQHCLIVESSPIIRRVARVVFEDLDFRVSDCETAAEALERIEGDPADLVITGWQLPGSNVFELISTIRAMPLPRRPFILYLTTENDAADLNNAFRAGADSYLLKPFNREIVEMKLHEIRVAA